MHSDSLNVSSSRNRREAALFAGYKIMEHSTFTKNRNTPTKLSLKTVRQTILSREEHTNRETTLSHSREVTEVTKNIGFGSHIEVKLARLDKSDQNKGPQCFAINTDA